MIEFRNVSKVYNKNVKALTNVNINIDKGEFVFLVGPSGAGKSTFIKMLLKEVEPSTGNVKMLIYLQAAVNQHFYVHSISLKNLQKAIFIFMEQI